MYYPQTYRFSEATTIVQSQYVFHLYYCISMSYENGIQLYKCTKSIVHVYIYK